MKSLRRYKGDIMSTSEDSEDENEVNNEHFDNFLSMFNLVLLLMYKHELIKF